MLRFVPSQAQFFFIEVLMLLVIAGAFKHLDSDVLLGHDQSIDELPSH